MTKFRNTPAGREFVASAESRETSPEIMEGIAFFARNLGEAEMLWNGDGFDSICTPLDIWECVTKNGLHDTAEFNWGAAGKAWWQEIGSQS